MLRTRVLTAVVLVPVVLGIIVLGEKPGSQEWIALALVVVALFIVLSDAGEARPTAAPLAPDD